MVEIGSNKGKRRNVGMVVANGIDSGELRVWRDYLGFVCDVNPQEELRQFVKFYIIWVAITTV